MSEFVSAGPRSSYSRIYWFLCRAAVRRGTDHRGDRGDLGRDGQAPDPAVPSDWRRGPPPASAPTWRCASSRVLGGFERAHIVFMSPTGTGYLNYVTAEALEFLTRGDVALVAMQYSRG